MFVLSLVLGAATAVIFCVPLSIFYITHKKPQWANMVNERSEEILSHIEKFKNIPGIERLRQEAAKELAPINPTSFRTKDVFLQRISKDVLFLQDRQKKIILKMQAVLRSTKGRNRHNVIYRPIRRVRAFRCSSRPTFTRSGGVADSGDSDSSESDPPGPGARAHHLSFVTFHSKIKNRPVKRPVNYWRVSRNTCGTQRERGRAA
jgi:hypothetical protein